MARWFFAPVLLLTPLFAGCASTPPAAGRYFVDVRGMQPVPFTFKGSTFVRPDVNWSRYTSLAPLTIELSYQAPDAESPLQPEEIQHLRDTWRTAVESVLTNHSLPLQHRITPTTLTLKVELVGVGMIPQEDAPFALSSDGTRLQVELRDGSTGLLVLAAEYAPSSLPETDAAPTPLTPEEVEKFFPTWAQKVADILARHLKQS